MHLCFYLSAIFSYQALPVAAQGNTFIHPWANLNLYIGNSPLPYNNSKLAKH